MLYKIELKIKPSPWRIDELFKARLALTVGYILISCFGSCASASLFVSKLHKIRFLLIRKILMEKISNFHKQAFDVKI